MLQTLAALDNRQVRVSYIDTSLDEAPLDRVALEGTSPASGSNSFFLVRSLVFVSVLDLFLLP